mmetsp:Transcript_16741/g.7946  ORF Transcript_16741/g.7946 Transcript_16741/m.7946 type:complete len:107 (-) Transcript_16741:206-526(-)
MFQFINSFNSLFYIAFIKTYYIGCSTYDPNVGERVFMVGESCEWELNQQLSIIYSIAFLKGLLDLAPLYFRVKRRMKEFDTYEDDTTILNQIGDAHDPWLRKRIEE